MLDNFRSFEAGPDPFGRIWRIEFRWLQTGISIRHADTVDVKFALSTPGEPAGEKVLAMPHPDLLEIAGHANREISDPWCMKLAALHMVHMAESFEDMDKTLVRIPRSELERYAAELRSTIPSAAR